MALRGITVLELAGLAPGPFCGMLLADFGAEVIRLDRVVPNVISSDAFDRGKSSIAIDMKKGKDLVLKLIDTVRHGSEKTILFNSTCFKLPNSCIFRIVVVGRCFNRSI